MAQWPKIKIIVGHKNVKLTICNYLYWPSGPSGPHKYILYAASSKKFFQATGMLLQVGESQEYQVVVCRRA